MTNEIEEHYREGQRLLELAEGTDLYASEEDYRARADARQLAIAHFAAAIAAFAVAHPYDVALDQYPTEID